MEQNLSSSGRVLMFCTERNVEKANAGAGGTGHEKMIVTADLMKNIDSNKTIPVIRQARSHIVPTFLKSKLFIDFSRDDQIEFAFDELSRSLHGAPLFIKPPVGNNPFTPIAKNPPERQGDAVLELMRLLVSIFEQQSSDNLQYAMIISRSHTSRSMLDILIAQAVDEDLITQNDYKDVTLTLKGKQYALHHRLAN